jgi:hypothetical protein
MSLIANFDIASDLQVYLFSWEDEDAFIINHSLLGGPDVLSTTELVPKQIECEVFVAEIETGFTADTPSSFSPFSGIMNLQLRGTNFDSFTNPNIILGRRIGLYLKDDLDQNIMLYAGYIQSFSFEYLPGQAVILNIEATDFLYYLNGYYVDIANTNTADFPTFEALQSIVADFRAPQENEAVLVRQSKLDVRWDNRNSADQLLVGNAGELIFNLMSGQQGYFFCSPGDFLGSTAAQKRNNIILYGRDDVLRLLRTGATNRLLKHGSGLMDVEQIIFDTSGDTGYCPSSINFSSDVNQIVNQVEVALSDDSLSVSVKDLESQSRFGTNGISESYQFSDNLGGGLFIGEAQLKEFAEFGLATNTTPVITNLAIPAITRLGELDIPGIEYGFYAGLPARVITEFNGATVDRNYLITKTRHSITADNWMINYTMYTR